jgi:hypothetical protein
MKTIDLGQKMSSKPVAPAKKWYPTVDFGDNGTRGEPSFSEDDIGKQITIKADIKLTGISSRSDHPKGKQFNYSFELITIHMPDDMESNKEALSRMQSDRAKKRGEA